MCRRVLSHNLRCRTQPARQWGGNANAGAQRDPHWLALKYAYRVRSGVSRGQPKGTVAHPYILSSAPRASYPTAALLPYNNPVPNTYEPSDGNWPNFGPNTSTKDDANKGYNDINFFYLCGPGAADIAMWYWPAPPNLNNYAGVQDPKNTSQTTTWNATDIGGVTRMRGYLVHLAWQIQPPGWSQPGMMEQYAGGGTTLQTETQAMNWESSGEQTTNGFYVTTWWNQSSASLFHDDIASDITVNNVPVVAEVNTSYLQNWPSSRGGLNHFITIIGYDDSTGQYAYTDTCGSTTKCGSNTDAGINWEPQTEMWTAVTSIQVNYNKGDGGWVW